MLEHEPNFWKRLWRIFVLIVILLIGAWLFYLYITYLPSEGEILELERLK